MKNSIAIVALLALLATGCHVTTSPTGTNTTSGSMTASVNGKAWSTIGLGSLVQTARAIKTDTGLVVVGADIDKSSISLSLLHPAVGTFGLGVNGTGNVAEFGYQAALKELYYSTTGSVTITKYDTVNRHISGSFYFTGYQVLDSLQRSVDVKSGTFVDVPWSN